MPKIIRWETPPIRAYKAYKKDNSYEILALCEELMDHPTEWAILRICNTAKEAHSLAWLLRQNRIKLPLGLFEFVARVSVRGEFAVYGRAIELKNERKQKV